MLNATATELRLRDVFSYLGQFCVHTERQIIYEGFAHCPSLLHENFKYFLSCSATDSTLAIIPKNPVVGHFTGYILTLKSKVSSFPSLFYYMYNRSYYK